MKYYEEYMKEKGEKVVLEQDSDDEKFLEQDSDDEK